MRRLLIATSLLFVVAVPAGAQTFLSFAGITFGGDAPKSKLTTGASLAFVGPAAGLEFELGYTPDFFNQQNGFALIADSNVTSFMGNILFGPLKRRVHPYGVIGLGVLRQRINATDLFNAVNTNDTAIDLGFGVTGMVSKHGGWRADVRYFRSLQDPSNDNDLDVTLGKFDFWRATGGLVVKF